ncbi:hypothetical protein T11_7029 [Trichinella zimbabwensis]|uniref:Uncharacterized protein n=1 Tax=Trichinella zimbabwensis TaxID=268475 RepID=A0A0V1H6N8_9BILA|nr:hypothetical protein T11_7029 [Trichinella zimbabwensis]
MKPQKQPRVGDIDDVDENEWYDFSQATVSLRSTFSRNYGRESSTDESNFCSSWALQKTLTDLVYHEGRELKEREMEGERSTGMEEVKVVRRVTQLMFSTIRV